MLIAAFVTVAADAEGSEIAAGVALRLFHPGDSLRFKKEIIRSLLNQQSTAAVTLRQIIMNN